MSLVCHGVESEAGCMPWQEDNWGQWVPVDELWRRNGAPETRWRVLLASRSLPNNINPSRRPCFGTRLCATEPGGRLGGPLGSLTS